MNGVVITAAVRPKATRKCLERILRHTPKPRTVLLIDNASPNDQLADLAREYPEVKYARFQDDKDGLTTCWNWGFSQLAKHGCDVIACVNDDAYVNSTWSFIWDEARGNPFHIMLGPVSSNPGVDYTGYQLAKAPAVGDDGVVYYWTDHVICKKNGKPYFNVNGFCFLLRADTVKALEAAHGSVMDAQRFPWGGQEENLGERLKALGGRIGVDTRTFVDHDKFSDWRRLGKK